MTRPNRRKTGHHFLLDFRQSRRPAMMFGLEGKGKKERMFGARGEREEGEEERLEPYLSSGGIFGLCFPASTRIGGRGFNGEESGKSHVRRGQS